jgi:hypothetical protein
MHRRALSAHQNTLKHDNRTLNQVFEVRNYNVYRKGWREFSRARTVGILRSTQPGQQRIVIST